MKFGAVELFASPAVQGSQAARCALRVPCDWSRLCGFYRPCASLSSLVAICSLPLTVLVSFSTVRGDQQVGKRNGKRGIRRLLWKLAAKTLGLNILLCCTSPPLRELTIVPASVRPHGAAFLAFLAARTNSGFKKTFFGASSSTSNGKSGAESHACHLCRSCCRSCRAELLQTLYRTLL